MVMIGFSRAPELEPCHQMQFRIMPWKHLLKESYFSVEYAPPTRLQDPGFDSRKIKSIEYPEKYAI